MEKKLSCGEISAFHVDNFGKIEIGICKILLIANLPGELAALTALVVAEPTFVRLLPRVALTVDRQV